MPRVLPLQLRIDDPTNILTGFIPHYREHLAVSRYSKGRRYLASVVHFGQWLEGEGHALSDIDETVIERFLSGHLPRCACQRPVPLRLIEVRAALNLLLRLLRARGDVALPSDDAVARELSSFDRKMAEVWGLSKGTRDHRCRIMRRFLQAQFGQGPIVLGSIKPPAVRSFVIGEPGWSTSTIRVMGGTMRCWLRYRELNGDQVTDLRRAVPRPAYWRDTALPETLTPNEMDELFASFSVPCPSRRRGYAMLRCLADLGLRCSEVAGLSLDDIDWHAGTLHIPTGKGRRGSILPLPISTGEAIADYLQHERPKTGCRSVFVRHVAPRGKPVGRRAVQKAIHAAYRRCGWDRTRIHILRHTLGSRLINAGTPMKQIADVLRHRSIVTSATYARVDVAKLSAVAMPWPGAAE